MPNSPSQQIQHQQKMQQIQNLKQQLEQLQQHSIDTVMEAGTPDELIKKLDTSTKKIGIAWVVDTSKVKQIAS